MFPISFIRLKSVGNFLRMKNHILPAFDRQITFNEFNLLSFNRIIPFGVVNQRCMAGHAKWQNIKFVKEAKDREKHNICNKYVRLVRYAVRESGPDPKSNNKLKNLLDEARRHNVPKETLENALKRGNDKKTKFGTVEILVPGGCMVILEYETSNVSVTRYEIKGVCKKYSANMLTGEGRWRAVFEQKGIITAVKELGGKELNEEKALDYAIEAGAEEVHMKEDEERKNFLEFICAPDDLHKVKKELEKQYEIEENYVAYLPTSTVQLSNEDMTIVDNFLEEMGSLPDVVRMYENVQ